MSEKKIRPFPNGTAYNFWQERNCEQCGKATWEDPWMDMKEKGIPHCPIQHALSAASVGSGEVNRRMAYRAGVLTDGCCTERVHVSQWDESMWRPVFRDPNQADIFKGLPIRNKKTEPRPLP